MDWVAFVIGVAVGWLVELVIDFFYWRRRRSDNEAVGAMLTEFDQLTAENKQLKENLARVELQLQTSRAGTAAPGSAVAPAGASTIEAMRLAMAARISDTEDDLKVVKGIGPKVETILKAAGVRTLAQLGALDIGRLERILSSAGDDYQIVRHNVGQNWIEQARLGARGAWDELARLQEKL